MGGPGGGNRNMSRVNVEKPKNGKTTLLRLMRYIGRSRYLLIGLLVLTLLVAVVDLTGPLLQGKAIDTIDNLRRGGSLSDLWPYLIAMGALFAASALMHYFMNLAAAKLSQYTVYTMRNDLFKKISRLPIGYTDSHKHGDIMSRITNDVENVSNAISSSITLLFSGILTIVGAFVMMLILSPVMTLVAMITIPLSITVSGKLTKFMRKYFTRRQKMLGALNGTVEEMVTSYGTVVAYGKERAAVEKFSEYSEGLRDCSVKARVWGSIMGPIMNFLGNLQYVLVAATGGVMILLGGPGNITIGNIQSMLSYSKSFTRPVNQIANQYSAILTALAGAERIFEIMDQASEIDEGREAPAIEGNVNFEKIEFAYVKGEPVLKGFDLNVKKGQKIAIVGATGSGKTTVVNLLTRFYELDGGRITVDGVDITKIPKEQLRRAIAIVLQDTVLFRDTIRNNIKYGAKDADDATMERAARHAKADVFINRLPDGYDTVLTEGGGNLSQGQRQLLAIARAVLADPKILILDEATSSVDTRTEMHIQQAMVELMKGRTSLIIAHRLSTIRDADVIVVLKNGIIAEAGDHETLLAAGGEYAKLYANQFAGIAT